MTARMMDADIPVIALVASAGGLDAVNAVLGPRSADLPAAILLLTSIGLMLGSPAIAVVLSRGGHDGATGATVVHDLGGTVLAAVEALVTPQ